MDAKTRMLVRQTAMFRAAKEAGFTQKAIAADAKIHINSIGAYARGETEMSGSAIDALHDALPDDIVSMLYRDGKAIVTAPVDMDLHELAVDMREFLRAKDAAHHPASEAGADIGPGEKTNLCSIAVRAAKKVPG